MHSADLTVFRLIYYNLLSEPHEPKKRPHEHSENVEKSVSKSKFLGANLLIIVVHGLKIVYKMRISSCMQCITFITKLVVTFCINMVTLSDLTYPEFD